MRNDDLKEKVLTEVMAGATPKECADRYGIPAGTIRSWLSRMKRRVADKKTATNNATRKTATNNATSQKASIKPKEPEYDLKDIDEELTERQRLFCLYYIRSFNASSSAIKAGYTAKYPAEIGYKLVHNPTVRKEIERLKELKRQSIVITEDDIVERYMRIAFADMTDFVTFGQKSVPLYSDTGTVVTDRNGDVLTEDVSYLSFNDHDQVDGGLICEIKKGRSGMSIKLEDRQKALNWLANFFEMNPMSKHKIAYDQEKMKIERETLELRKKESELKAW